MKIMVPFQVWVRPLGNTSRVRVAGLPNAEWLLGRLGRSFVFKMAEPINEEPDSSFCTFRVQYNPQVSHRGLERLLAAMPEVVLMMDPA